jgi:hypothetical protein
MFVAAQATAKLDPTVAAHMLGEFPSGYAAKVVERVAQDAGPEAAANIMQMSGEVSAGVRRGVEPHPAAEARRNVLLRAISMSESAEELEAASKKCMNFLAKSPSFNVRCSIVLADDDDDDDDDDGDGGGGEEEEEVERVYK